MSEPEKIIRRLQGGSVLAEWGPMRLVISAFVGKVPQPESAVRAGRQAFAYFEEIARQRPLMASGHWKTGPWKNNGLVGRMIQSVTAVGEEDLTPMAAVAGTIADGVADDLAAQGMTRVVVDNGGDVAVRLQGDEPVTVGIRPEVNSPEISHVLFLGPDRRSWGIATSGLAGRSLTRGVASAVTAVAVSASLADAAATAVANAAFVEDPLVIQRPAEEVDPYTDIRGLPVTVKAGPLSDGAKSLAVERALRRAQELISAQVILGAFVAVQGMVGMTEGMKRLVEGAD